METEKFCKVLGGNCNDKNEAKRFAQFLEAEGYEVKLELNSSGCNNCPAPDGLWEKFCETWVEEKQDYIF